MTTAKYTGGTGRPRCQSVHPVHGQCIGSNGHNLGPHGIGIRGIAWTDADVMAMQMTIQQQKPSSADIAALRRMGIDVAGLTVDGIPVLRERSDGVLRKWDVIGPHGDYRVELRIAVRGEHKGERYMFCPCPAWKYSGKINDDYACKHTSVASGYPVPEYKAVPL